MTHTLKGILSLVLATVIWGGAFVAQSAGMELIGPFTFQTVRCLLAVIALLILVTVLEIRNLKQSIKKWADKRLWLAGAVCGLALFVATSLQQVGLVDTDAGKAGFITAMYIVIVPVFGIFLRRRPSIAAVISVFIAVIGMYLLCCAGVTQISVSDILILGCAVAFAAQITLIDRFAPDTDPLRLNCIQALVVTVLSAVPMFLKESPQLQQITDCCVSLSYAGVLSMGFAYSLQIVGQKHLEPTAASLIMSLESVFAVIFGALLLQERMTPWETAGSILVFLAVVLSQIPTPTKNKVAL